MALWIGHKVSSALTAATSAARGQSVLKRCTGLQLNHWTRWSSINISNISSWKAEACRPVTTCTARDPEVRFRNLPSTIAYTTVFASTSWRVAAAIIVTAAQQETHLSAYSDDKASKSPGPYCPDVPMMPILRARVTGPVSLGTTEVELMNYAQAHSTHRLCRRKGVIGAVGYLSNCLLSALHWDLLQAWIASTARRVHSLRQTMHTSKEVHDMQSQQPRRGQQAAVMNDLTQDCLHCVSEHLKIYIVSHALSFCNTVPARHDLLAFACHKKAETLVQSWKGWQALQIVCCTLLTARLFAHFQGKHAKIGHWIIQIEGLQPDMHLIKNCHMHSYGNNGPVLPQCRLVWF